ncbi:hypothetical protein DFH07DRAFT_810985 [Mycena maculata]|uniref:Gfd2/YDR514C-like C-terminal domain-containing protein n=1 Tax=Mycena maculata TaxID=230809 RepID=A0AAD7JK28_9AGAR|nr:hypothetical protein DFH07DRAFT_810985 [Mycena maculata]
MMLTGRLRSVLSHSRPFSRRSPLRYLKTMPQTPIVTGYYRYTDIWFQENQCRPEVLPASQSDPLKGVLAHDALVHPDNPLHPKPGVEGISMYQGTFHDGESRLLFSSAQVDYVRYWLHAMSLTKEIIPLPYSECLLTPSEFSSVSPVEFKTGGALRGAVKKIEKNNKRLKGSNVQLTSRRDAFERVRNLWATKNGIWCALDFEAWERDHSVITEFGYSSVHWNDGLAVEDRGHFTVKESRMYRNGQFVSENREHYNFGESVEITKAGLKRKIADLISDMHRHGPVFLVFHDPSQDMKDLKTLEAGVDAAVYQLPDKSPKEGIFVVDTAILFAALEGESQNTRGLEQVCNHLQISTKNLHNAGNDAHYTLLALREVASGEPLDTQRELRWPNRTGEPANNTGVKVKFEAYEEDSDYSDQEGVMGPATSVLT